ncbi:MAG: oxygenase MpaB family protein [Spongiibacteraceae bacterium]
MLNIKIDTNEIRKNHMDICPQVYNDIDLTATPERFRSIPPEDDELWSRYSQAEKEMVRDPHLQEPFRQLSMSGDPVADAFASKFPELKHGVAMQMLATALDEGISAVKNPPPELVALMAEVDHVPEWLDYDALDRTSEIIAPFIYALGHTGWRAGFVLTFGNAYQALPMAATGALNRPETAPGRIKETLGVINYLAIPGGLRRDGEALKILVRVRVMHSLVRTNLLKNPKAWNVKTHGIPLPQSDMFSAWALVAQGLELMEKLNGQPMNMSAIRYLAYLTGVDTRIPTETIEEFKNVFTMINATLHDNHEQWASDLAEMALSAQMQPARTLRYRMWDMADRKLGTIAITKYLGKQKAEQLGVKVSPINYLWSAAVLAPVIGTYTGLKLLEKLPGGRGKVREFCVNYAFKNMGLDLKYDTNPKDYSYGEATGT